MINTSLVSRCMIDMACIAATELFGGYGKGMKSRSLPKQFVFKRKFPDRKTLVIKSAAQPEGFHLLLLEALSAMTQEAQNINDPGGKKKYGKKLLKGLKLRKAAIDDPVAMISTSLKDVAAQIGREFSTTLIRQFQKALADLSNVRLIWHDPQGRELEASNLVSYILTPAGWGAQLYACLSPALSNAGFTEKYPYVEISMDEARKFKKTSTVILHAWLCSLIRPGTEYEIKTRLLVERVIWRDDAKIGKSSYYSRRSIIRNKILPDLEKAGWQIEARSETIVFKRPELPAGLTPMPVAPSFQPYPEYVVTDKWILPGKVL